MGSIKDENGHNQIFVQTNSTIIRFSKRVDLFLKEIGNLNSGDILEIGCGIGTLSNVVANKTNLNVLGTDISQPFLDMAKSKYQKENLEYMYLDFNNPEVLNGKKFDFVIGNGILHHLYYNLDHALAKIKDLLKDGGKMIFMEPNIYNPYCAVIFKIPMFSRLAHLEPDEMAFSKTYISNKLKKVGYSKVDVEYRDFLLPGIPDFLVKPSIVIGDIAEKVPLVKNVSQSLFIVGQK